MANEMGGSFVPGADVNFTGAVTIGGSAVSTVGGTQTLVSKTLTSPTITAPVISGATTIGAGATITSPIVKPAVTASGGTARILTAATSGSVNLFDSASAGILYTLPAPVVGLQFSFVSTVLQTGGAIKVITDAGTTLLVGAVTMYSGEKVTPSSTLGPFQFNSPAASSFISFNMNGTTTGGGIGTYVNFLCVSATAWMVTGTVVSPSGSLATPFANS